MIVALILLNICFMLAHVCEGINWMFYPLAIVGFFSIIIALDSYENLKKRIESLEKERGGEK